MSRRPLSVTFAGWIFVVVGGASLALRAGRFLAEGGGASGAGDLAWAVSSALLALVGGAWVLRGAGWARWVLVGWMAAHVVLSLMHSTSELIAHVLIFSAVLVLLFRPAASAFLRRTETASMEDPRAS
jgi:hypothetical protein